MSYKYHVGQRVRVTDTAWAFPVCPRGYVTTIARKDCAGYHLVGKNGGDDAWFREWEIEPVEDPSPANCVTVTKADNPIPFEDPYDYLVKVIQNGQERHDAWDHGYLAAQEAALAHLYGKRVVPSYAVENI